MGRPSDGSLNGPHDGTQRNADRRAHPHPRWAATAPLDGARWPRCDALKFELPPLVGSLEPDTGTTVRVMVDPADRPGAPHTVMAPGRPGPEGEAHVITVDCGTVGRRVLLLIPPEGEPAPSTARLLTAATDPENP
ncbi:DUF5994 family protein [Streptomyces sp. NPDC051917]|uniref:DUF5994 family protein n=1 Tax=Streptomyces sp. NPDC051917 TaxID=3154754 RepID=UPI00344B84D6